MGRYVIEEDTSQPGRYQLEEPGVLERAGNWIRDTFGPNGNLRGSAIGGVMQGMANPVVGAIQLGTHALGMGDKVDPTIAAKEQEYQNARAGAGRPGFDAAQLVGEIASPANLVLGAVTGPARGARMGEKILSGVEAGALSGAATPVTDSEDYWSNKGKQIATGTAVGGTVPVAGRAIAKVVSPNASVNDSVRKLIDAGVRLTPGQALGGMAARTEDKARSFFGLGDAITAAQKRGESDLNVSVINKGLELVGPLAGMPSKVMAPGHDSIAQLRATAQKAYDNLVPHLHADLNDNQFYANVQLIRNHISQMPQQEQNAINHIIDREIGHRTNQFGMLVGTDLQDAMSAIRDHSVSFGRSSSKYERDAGEALRALHSELRDLLERTNPQYADEFSNINSAYRILKTVDRAASSVASPEGVFTPSHFHAAVKSGDITKDKRAFSEGEAFLQDLSGPAKSIMSSHYNDSGTAGRLALSAGALASGVASPAIPLSLLGSSAMYAPWIQDKIVKAIVNRPNVARPLSSLLEAGGQYATPGVAGHQSKR